MKKALCCFIMLFVATIAVLAPSVAVSAADFNILSPCDNPDITIDQDVCSGNPAPHTDTSDVKTLITNIIRYLLIGVGILAVIMIIFSAIRIATSGGNPETIKGGKNTLLWAVIGLILALLAITVVNLVVDVSNRI
ncbi:hypothetical protein FACS189431_2340 [Alphaproteobacteria bacterium]|nr:hypothetical protein FACS189431_2340 [Alphaproteobacteria bacterium]